MAKSARCRGTLDPTSPKIWKIKAKLLLFGVQGICLMPQGGPLLALFDLKGSRSEVRSFYRVDKGCLRTPQLRANSLGPGNYLV